MTAIEADILMSPHPGDPLAIPVMAHPPVRESDLTFEAFIGEVCTEGSKHVKCDFKELEAVSPCLDLLEASPLNFARQAVYLNADVLPGPGKRGEPATVDGEAFMRACKGRKGDPVLSLGWSTNVARVYNSGGYYTGEDCDAMAGLVERHGLKGGGGGGAGGVVFAANFRVAGRDLEGLKGLLRRVEGSQLLLWTGTGEPSVNEGYIDWMKREMAEFEGRVGFDCKLSEGRLEGWVNEAAISVLNIFNRLRGLGGIGE